MVLLLFTNFNKFYYNSLICTPPKQNETETNKHRSGPTCGDTHPTRQDQQPRARESSEHAQLPHLLRPPLRLHLNQVILVAHQQIVSRFLRLLSLTNPECKIGNVAFFLHLYHHYFTYIYRLLLYNKIVFFMIFTIINFIDFILQFFSSLLYFYFKKFHFLLYI